jgi:diguanylate cyclase (GGDEF)-like protein
VVDEEGRVIRYVSTFSDISAIKDAEARLHNLAHHDPLTGLANRLQFTAQLDSAIERSRRHQAQFALLFLDLDRFKIINDTLSHTSGDILLRTVATRLQTLVRGEDTVARWGGDEFVVIAEGIAQAEDAAVLAEKIHGSLTQPVEIGDDNVTTTVSIGICIFPDDATESADLVRMADSAMYHAKDAGRNRYQFYRAEMTQKALHYLALHKELRHAIEQQTLTLQYQSQVSLEDGHIEGFEALLRWQHPQLGLLFPTSFLHIAEETGLIQPIGEWVLRTVCDQIRVWQQEGIPSLRVAVNISGRELLHSNLAERIAEIVKQSGLRPEELMIDLEITENLQQAGEPVVRALHSLRNIGLGLSIDDFGTGYSSLSLLRHLPVDRLKIDKTFIADVPESEESCSVVRAILALGRSLRLRVVAEGVENQEQLQFLTDNGCELAQGYYLSKPVGADAVAALFS